MSSLPNHCSHCGTDTCRDRDAGLTYCSACGKGWSERIRSLAKANPEQCPFCGSNITPELEANAGECNACHRPLPDYLRQLEWRTEQKRWRKWAWFFFLSTPFLSALGISIPWLLESISSVHISSIPEFRSLVILWIVGTPFLGAYACGYCLVKQRSEIPDAVELIAMPLFYAVSIMIIYGCLLFVGISFLRAIASSQ